MGKNNKGKETFKPVSFSISEGEKKGEYQLIRSLLNVPKLGIVKASVLAEMPEVLAHLVNINSSSVVKVSDVAPQENTELLEARIQYEELSGKKAGNKKLETLLKEIEAIKSGG